MALSRPGGRVSVALATTRDLTALRTATESSQQRITRWGPSGLDGLEAQVTDQGPGRLTFLVHVHTSLRVAAAGHGIAARINLNSIVRGRASWATLGYDAFDPYAGRGLLREGLALVVDHAFAREPDGLGLHRLEAGVQPGNDRSALLLRSLGFVPEGFSPRLLWVPTLIDLADDWRDHDRFALAREDWPGSGHLPQVAFRPPARRRVVCVVNGAEDSGQHALAVRLGVELGVPLLRRELLRDDDLFTVLAESPCGAVISGPFAEADEGWLRAGLTGAGYDPAHVPEVRCAGGDSNAGGGRTAYRVGLGPSWEAPGALASREIAALAARIAADQH
ncbi:MAG TPA: GNAT family protein [Dermatophilaceae bacterium]|nr:GNAT family protein [Dermatophilaceae bacterium]